MSYILDALNKSEKDRASNSMPGMRGQLNDQPQRAMSSGQIFISLAALVIVNCLGVYWYFGTDERSQTALPVAGPATDISPVIEPGPSAVYLTDAQSTVAQEVEPAPQPLAEAPTLITPQYSRPRSNPIDDARITARGPPTVEITAHIYADDAEFRMVNIDGVARREGDKLPGGYRVLRITESGVIFSLGEDQYELNVVEDWQLVPAEKN